MNLNSSKKRTIIFLSGRVDGEDGEGAGVACVAVDSFPFPGGADIEQVSRAEKGRPTYKRPE